jgi:hypothetical protein
MKTDLEMWGWCRYYIKNVGRYRQTSILDTPKAYSGLRTKASIGNGL